MFKTLRNTNYCIPLLFSILIFYANLIQANTDTLQNQWLNDSYPDSIRFNAINEFYKKKIKDEPTAVLSLTRYHYDLARQKKSIEEIVNANKSKALALKLIGRYDEALKELNNLVEISSNQSDTIGLAENYQEIGSILHYQSKYLDAVKYLSKSLRLYQKKDLESAQARVYNSLGRLYNEINNFDMAIGYFEKGIQIAQKLNQVMTLNIITVNLGFTNYQKKNYREAILNGHKSIKVFKSYNNRVGLADSYYLLAQSHQAQNKIDSALFYIEKSLDINMSIGNMGQIIPTKLLYADILFETNKDQATRIVKDLLPQVDAAFGYEYLTQLHHLLYRCNKAQGNQQLALIMLEKYSLYRDSLLIEEDNLMITRQALQTTHEIELLNKELENEKKQSTLKYRQLKRTFAIILGSIIVIFITGVYARLNIINQKREKEGLLKEIEQLKKQGNTTVKLVAPKFELNRDKIENSINKKINETDWKVLNILSEDPVISNKEIAQKAYLSVDGIGSCLRRMYVAFDISESKYKKISLIMKAIKLSNITSEIEKNHQQTEN